MIELLDAVVGPIKERDRGFGAGSCWWAWLPRSWLGRISWLVWTVSVMMVRGSSHSGFRRVVICSRKSLPGSGKFQ
jgi:hypothetical protein